MSQPNTPKDEPISSTNAAAQAYQQAFQKQSATPTATPTPAPTMPDIVMSDSTPDRPASPAVAAGANAPSPVPARIGTPSRNTNGDVTSRATSQHPDPAPTIPKEAPPHGAPTRQYLNGKVTGVLLDGMKQLAKEQYVTLFAILYHAWETTGWNKGFMC
ncbi:hypothetical protein LSUE1_G003977 [Lachnellula suecica]|uniref:Uncharacterized protein n=1 Tax=Lachnellula suecica TaxID=602035 RepID=A0A8T9C3Y4_9HELO|nr:hypothetical protein LSUE1_G003977 [Lachnellula suecica]